MKALVTGASGFLGANVVKELLSSGASVRALVLAGDPAPNLAGLAAVERAVGDVTDAESVRRALDGCDTVFHLAAIYKLWLPDPSLIFRVNVDGTNLRRLTNTPGYDAEATVAKDGRIVFTSTRDGDMDIYSMNGDGSDVKRLTNLPGPDGGPFFSADGTKIVFRGRHPAPGQELDDYVSLLKKGLWRPTALDVFVMNRDGSGLRQVTRD